MGLEGRWDGVIPSFLEELGDILGGDDELGIDFGIGFWGEPITESRVGVCPEEGLIVLGSLIFLSFSLIGFGFLLVIGDWIMWANGSCEIKNDFGGGLSAFGVDCDIFENKSALVLGGAEARLIGTTGGSGCWHWGVAP